MTVISPVSIPMIGRAATASADASPGTGFGDLLNVLNAPVADSGQDGGVATAPATNLSTALPDPSLESGADVPVAPPAPADATVPTDTLPIVTLPATNPADGDGMPAATGPTTMTPAMPLADSPAGSTADSDATAAPDTSPDVAASPAVAPPRVDPVPAPRHAATAPVATRSRAATSTDVPDTSSPAPDTIGQAVVAGQAPLPAAAGAAAGTGTTAPFPSPSDSATAGLQGRAAQKKSATAAPTSLAVPVESVATSAPGDDSTKAHSSDRDDRGKAKSTDRTADNTAPQTIAQADQPVMPLASAITVPVPAEPRPGAGPDKDDNQQTAASPTLSSDAAAPQSAGSPVQSSQSQPGQDNLPSLLASQTPGASIERSAPSIQPYAAAPNIPAQPVVAAQPGRIGRDLGVEIARQVSAGRQEVLVRLDPAEMGRIDVRLSFDAKGQMHAAMSADSPAALDMLRRDAGDLGRALANAGIQADPSTFRFDSRGGDTGQSAQHQQQNQGGQRDHSQDRDDGNRRSREERDLAALSASYRQLRTSGRVDLTA